MKRSARLLTLGLCCLLVLGACTVSAQDNVSVQAQTQPVPADQGVVGERPEAPTAAAVGGFEAPPSQNPVINTLTRSFSARQFAAGEIPVHDIELILFSGARAQSARNAQPWRFTVVTNYEDVAQMHSTTAPGNIVIIISGRVNNVLPTTEFDCGIAAGYIQIAAESMGYGARILVGPVNEIEEQRDHFGIPEGYRALVAILIGHADDALDGFSTATPRSSLSEIVNWVD
ncbi:MAG: nitroreductase family protein [Oscillospiraceae bacterium]|nr:nitroreductase family protein [Oscillospiraceae bacterium]